MKILNISPMTITIELKNDKPYYYDKEYDVFLNDSFLFKDNRNVITIFNLSPNNKYKLKILDDEILFETLNVNKIINIKDYTYHDGINDDTNNINNIIDKCEDDTLLYFDKGYYLITSLFLKNNITLYLNKDAILYGITDRNKYSYFKKENKIGVWEGNYEDQFFSTINMINCNNINIIGEGEIYPNASNSDWYINHRIKNIAYRGHAIYSNNSNNINIIGIYIHDTQSWAIHPFKSNNINIYNIFIKNNPNMPTTDGIDPDMSKNMNIMGCIFDVGDDCIAIKSGTYNLALELNTPSSNIYIANNLMRSGHGGIVFGSESSAGINNIHVEKCIFENTDRGFRIKTRRGRGHIGIIDNIIFDNIIMNNVKTPFVINMYYNMGPKGGHDEYVWSTKYHEFNEYTPIIKDFKFSNIKCYNIEYAAGVFLGLPESKIGSLEFENIVFNYKDDANDGYPVMIEHNFKMKKNGIYAFNVENIITNNVIFIGNDGEEIRKEES